MSHIILNTRRGQNEQQQQQLISSTTGYNEYHRLTMYSNRNEINIFIPTIKHYNRIYTLTVRRTKRSIFSPFVVVVVVWMTTTTVFSTISGSTCNIPSSKSLSQPTHQQLNPIFRVGNDKNNIKLRFCIDCEDGTGNVHNNEDTVVNSDIGCSEVLQQQQEEGEGEREEQSGYVTQRTIPNNNIAIPHGGSSASVPPSNVSPDSNSSIRDIHDDSNHDSSNNNNSNDLTTVSHQILQEFHTEVQQIMKMNLITLQQLVTNVTNEIRLIKDEQRRLSLEQQQQQQHEQQGTSTDTNIDSLNSTMMDGVDVPITPSNTNDSDAIMESEPDSLSSTSIVDDNSIDDTGNADEQIPVDFIPSLDDSTNDTITTLFNDTTSIKVDEDIDTASVQTNEDIESEIDSSIAEPAKVTPTDNYNFDDDGDYLDLDKPIATSKVSISSSTTTTATGNDINIVDDLHQNTNDVSKKTTKIGKKKKRKNKNTNKSTIINTPTVVKPKNKQIPFIPTSTITDVDDDDDDLSVNDNVESEDEIDDIQQLPTTTEVLHCSLQKLVKSIITSVLFCFLYIILKRFVHILLRGLGVQLQSSSAIMDPKSQCDGSTAKTILPKP